MGKPSSLDIWGIFGFSSSLGHIFLAAGADGGLEQSGGEYFQDRYGCMIKVILLQLANGLSYCCEWKILEGCRYITRWWFEMFLDFHLDPWGNNPIWQAYFFKWVVQPPTRYSLHNLLLWILCAERWSKFVFSFLISTPQLVLGSTYLIMRQRWQLRSFAQWNITTSPQKN